MDKILSTLLVLFLFWTSPLVATAQEETGSLARAIYRLKTGSREHLGWRECGTRLSREEAAQRAEEYASYFLAEHEADSNFNPWIGAAIAMQESSFNRCAISRDARIGFEEHLGHRATEGEIVRLLTNPAYRRRMGVHTAFDAGLVQFRWPGAVASMVGITDASTLVDARVSIHMLAVSMRHYREICATLPSYRGTHTVNRDDGTTRVVRYDIPCTDGYWVQHNSPSSFNYGYYSTVTHWYEDLLEFSMPPEHED